MGLGGFLRKRSLRAKKTINNSKVLNLLKNLKFMIIKSNLVTASVWQLGSQCGEFYTRYFITLVAKLPG